MIKSKNRQCEFLSDSDIIQYCELEELLLLFLARVDRNKIFYDKLSNYIKRDFGIKVAKYAIKNNADAIVLYDTYAFYTEEFLKKKSSKIVLIMDMSAANLFYMKKVYEEDMLKCPSFAKKLYSERKMLWNKTEMEMYAQEIQSVDYFFAPSDFVEKSLIYSGILKEKIFICPYGSNFIHGEPRLMQKVENQPLFLIYVGSISAMKGIWYLLEAVKKFSKDQVDLTLLGNYDNSSKIFDKYFDRFNFIGQVTHDKVKEICLSKDVFIFPSLGEGMSLSVLEALSLGLPCVVTENSGFNNLIVDSYNGFVIPIENIEKICEKIQWYLDNKNDLIRLSKNALDSVQSLTWIKYENRVFEILKEIELHQKNSIL